MHQTSTLHSVQPKPALTSKASFLFSAKAFLISFFRKLLLATKEDSLTVPEPVFFRQFTLKRTKGKPVYFGKWCRLVYAEENLLSQTTMQLAILSPLKKHHPL